MNKDYVEPMIADENGNIYFSAKYLSENKDKEIKRLNNIINELEKWLTEKQDLVCGCGITLEYIYAYEACLDKLQELKGDSSNE